MEIIRGKAAKLSKIAAFLITLNFSLHANAQVTGPGPWGSPNPGFPLPIPFDPCMAPISVGDTKEGELSLAVNYWPCPSEGRGSGYLAGYYRFSHSGGPIHIDLISVHPRSFDTYMFLRQGVGRGGNIIAQDDDGHDDLRSSRIKLTNLAAGSYTIEASSYAADVTGAYTLSIYGDKVTAKATGRRNDTGVRVSAQVPDTSGYVCEGEMIFGRQDCNDGRDTDPILGYSSAANNNDGMGGFSFLKVAAEGAPLDASATDWSCLKDNVTGLMWQVKRPGIAETGLHRDADRFTWLAEHLTNSGLLGDKGNRAICHGYQASQPSTYCNTHAYVERVNNASLCGYSDWRMPTVQELQGIATKDDSQPSQLYVVNGKISNEVYWAREAYTHIAGVDKAYSVWLPSAGDVSRYEYSFENKVRLVRGDN